MGWRETLQREVCEAEKARGDGAGVKVVDVPVTLAFRPLPPGAACALIGTVNARPIGDLPPRAVLVRQCECGLDGASLTFVARATGIGLPADATGLTGYPESDFGRVLDGAEA